jgi:hypothetical protein
MRTSQAAGDHVIHGQIYTPLATILAGEIIPAQYLTLSQANREAGALYHPVKPDNGRAGIIVADSPDYAAPIQHQAGFTGQD